jgi:hypothetical protein
MGRRKAPVVGAVLDLTGMEEGALCDIDALIAAMETKVEEPAQMALMKTDEELLAEIKDGTHCRECLRSIFSVPKIWKGQKMCSNCHALYRRKEYTKEISDYVRSVYRRGCAFCSVRAGGFHLDHINMFSKVNSVGVMMEQGAPSAEIVAEIDKCQLLCVNCHGLVTKFEEARGFITQKKGLTKRAAKGEDVTAMRQELHDTYERVMTKMYPLIREKALRVWEEGGTD